MTPKQTGEFIRKMREEKNLTQKELANLLQVTDKAISRWETGKGYPETSLLQPLSNALGVSVGELLAGERIPREETTSRTDALLVDSLEYAKASTRKAISIFCLLIGIGLLSSPAFTSGTNVFWILGVDLIVFSLRHSIGKLPFNLLYQLFSLVLLLETLLLESLPLGAVLSFSQGPNAIGLHQETYSYFSLVPFGYANFTPLITGILTILAVLACLISLACALCSNRSSHSASSPCRKERHCSSSSREDRSCSMSRCSSNDCLRKKSKGVALVCNILATLFSLVPLFLFGPAYMTGASYCVTALLIGASLLQFLCVSPNVSS